MTEPHGPQQALDDRVWEDRREVRTSASADRAWRAWADPRGIQGWFADEAEGSAEPGSVLIHRFPAMGFEARHEVIESEPGRRVVLQMSYPGRRPITQEITVRMDGGETVIELVNSGFGGEDWEGQFEGIDSGWRLALAQLRHYLEQHWNRRRHVWLSLRPVRLDPSRVAPLFRSSSGLSRWLTDGPAGAGISGDTGAAVSLALRDYHSLTGHVLADSGREILLSWDELEGTIELKAFSTGPASGMVGLRVSSWADRPPSREALQRWMDGAAGRLAGALAS